jgi:hypothetical protein
VAWRASPDREVERVRAAFVVADPPTEALPSRRVHWGWLRDTVGVKMAVILEESIKVLERVPRDAVSPKRPMLPANHPKVLPSRRKDATDEPRPPP